jgi:hypothetical protein
MSIVRTSERPASAALSEPVKVSTMIKPKSASEMRSIGSSHPLARGSAADAVIEEAS